MNMPEKYILFPHFFKNMEKTFLLLQIEDRLFPVPITCCRKVFCSAA